MLEYIKTSKPTYCEFEAWVKKNGTTVDKSLHRQAQFRHRRGYIHDDDTRKGILGRQQIGGQTPPRAKTAVNLNNLDDWSTNSNKAWVVK